MKTKLALSLLLGALFLHAAPTAAVAEEGDAVTVVYDATDLAATRPWLAEVLRATFPLAKIVVPGRFVLLVEADPPTQEAIARVLAWLRGVPEGRYDDLEAATRFRAHLARHAVSGEAADVDLAEFLRVLGMQQDLQIVIADDVAKRTRGMTVTLKAEDETLDAFLDQLVALVGASWVIEGPGVVRFESPRPTVRPGLRVEFEDGEARFVDPTFLAEVQDEALREQITALREEIRALRAEIGEIKEMLTKGRSR